MCTVTFIAKGDMVFITSNRDEKRTRQRALPPAEYEFEKCSLLFPKDADAGGTWIAAKNNGNAAVLLNGAFEAHISAPPYKQSRGLVLVDILKNGSPLSCLSKYDCKGIEPFSLLLFTEKNLYECRWDGAEKFIKSVNGNASIWSSVTLYTPEVINKRQQWFDKWLSNFPQPSQNDIIDFHRFGGDGDNRNDFFMNRSNETFTVSITSIAISNRSLEMNYFDASANKSFVKEIVVANNEMTFV